MSVRNEHAAKPLDDILSGIIAKPSKQTEPAVIVIHWYTKTKARMRYVLGTYVEVLVTDARKQQAWIEAREGERFAQVVTERALRQLTHGFLHTESTAVAALPTTAADGATEIELGEVDA